MNALVRRVRKRCWAWVEPRFRTVEAAIAAALFRFPTRHLKVIGVTGTDGKTTTCHLIGAMLEAAGDPVGIVSTVSEAAVRDSKPFGHELTTPNPWRLQRLLRTMSHEGARWAVLEATSHGLALRRLACVRFEVAVLTSISRDHLDFHGSMDRYVEAKTKLFKRRPRLSVLNRDVALAERFERFPAGRRIYYGLSGGDVTAEQVVTTPRTKLTLKTPIGTRRLRLARSGLMEANNALAAAAVGVGIGLELDHIVNGLEHAPRLPGRLEWVQARRGDFRVVIDHAHTENALVQLYATLRPLAPGRLLAVLGVDGDRDPGKRAQIGLAAATMCEFVTLTTTHPRKEAPEAIVDRLREGVEQAGLRPNAGFEVVPDRRAAILSSLAKAREGDIVVLNGIGHEPYLAGRQGKITWSERGVVEEALERLDAPVAAAGEDTAKAARADD